jgi:hypothetical protein
VLTLRRVGIFCERYVFGNATGSGQGMLLSRDLSDSRRDLDWQLDLLTTYRSIFNIFSPSLMQPSCSSLHSLNTLNYTTCFGL